MGVSHPSSHPFSQPALYVNSAVVVCWSLSPENIWRRQRIHARHVTSPSKDTHTCSHRLFLFPCTLHFGEFAQCFQVNVNGKNTHMQSMGLTRELSQCSLQSLMLKREVFLLHACRKTVDYWSNVCTAVFLVFPKVEVVRGDHIQNVAICTWSYF